LVILNFSYNKSLMDEQQSEELQKVLSVSQFIESLNAALHEIKAKIIGEVISVNIAVSGHVYFTLKDKEKDSVIDCIIWRSNYHINGVIIKTGEEYVLSGYPNVYANRGTISFIANTIEQVGEGTLKKAYDELKLKLMREGLLSKERKRKLPSYPQTIGIISSKQGAVIHDFLNNLGQRGYKIRFRDTRVEGKDAIFDILSSIKQMNKEKIDILVIMRGGGSLQSLSAFDNEEVVRAIATFPVPVLAAIGHHQDVPLTALAADSEVSTPTAAANLFNSVWDDAEMLLDRNINNIFGKYKEILNSVALTIQFRKEEIEEKFGSILYIFQQASQNIQIQISRMQENLRFQYRAIHEKRSIIFNKFKISKNEKQTLLNAYFFKLPFLQAIKYSSNELHNLWLNKIVRAYSYELQKANSTQWNNNIFRIYSIMIKNSHTTLAHNEELIHLNNPTRILSQGYSILTNNGRVVKYIKDVKIGDSLVGLLSDGEISASINSTKKRN
jgi:exodeoxyribonuclease VII large subunit